MTELWTEPPPDDLDGPIPDHDQDFAARWQTPGGGPDLNLMNARQLDRYLASVVPRQTPRRDDDGMVTIDVIDELL